VNHNDSGIQMRQGPSKVIRTGGPGFAARMILQYHVLLGSIETWFIPGVKAAALASTFTPSGAELCSGAIPQHLSASELKCLY
jgi:hypothetical protein